MAARQRLPEQRQLTDISARVPSSSSAEPLDQLQVGVPGDGGLLGGGDVLADHVQGDFQAPVGEVLDDRDDLVDRLAGDEAVDDRPVTGAAETSRRIRSLREAARITGPSTGHLHKGGR